MLLTLAVIGAVAVLPTSAQRQPPHILFIVADDLGQLRPFMGHKLWKHDGWGVGAALSGFRCGSVARALARACVCVTSR